MNADKLIADLREERREVERQADVRLEAIDEAIRYLVEVTTLLDGPKPLPKKGPQPKRMYLEAAKSAIERKGGKPASTIEIYHQLQALRKDRLYPRKVHLRRLGVALQLEAKKGTLKVASHGGGGRGCNLWDIVDK